MHCPYWNKFHMDTEWQRYEVFAQERADGPHRHAGAVHAPDAEMALENARDVFVRRPNCLSLWVVPAAVVYARTAEELRDAPERPANPGGGGDAPAEPFLIFQKQGQTARETYVAHVGQVEASSPPLALAQALVAFPRQNVFVWWVVPDRAVIRSAPGDAPSLFDPAHAKPYRNHLAYPVEPVMRELRSAQEMLNQE